VDGKLLALAGGCKSTEYFCPQCMVSRKTIGDCKVGDDRCAVCCRLHLDHCYCHEVVNDDVLDCTRQQLASYIEAAYDDGFKRFDGIKKKSTIIFDVHIASKDRTKKHVGYELKSKKENTQFIKFLNDELEI
jgi:hypothetical protein